MTVYLVGAGPGDPGLMTARALELIARADVIVYDRLIPDTALDGARPDAELIYAGKEGGGPSVAQEEIESWLVAHGHAGRRSCGSRAVTRSCSVAAARRPRRCARPACPSRSCPASPRASPRRPMPGSRSPTATRASAVAFVTGHEDPDKPDSALDWARWPPSRARSSSTWACASCPQIAERLLGRRPSRRAAGRGDRARDAARPAGGQRHARHDRRRRCRGGRSAPRRSRVFGAVAALRRNARLARAAGRWPA